MDRTGVARLEAVRLRVEQWRGSRTKRTRMPEELWDAAATVARDHGLWAVSRALRVNYESLRRRVERGERVAAARAVDAAGFVELAAAQAIGGSTQEGTVVELTGVDGAKLAIRIEGRTSLDMQALVEGFWRRDR